LAIVLSVLRITDSDYPFGIFKLFLLYISGKCKPNYFLGTVDQYDRF